MLAVYLLSQDRYLYKIIAFCFRYDLRVILFYIFLSEVLLADKNVNLNIFEKLRSTFQA